MTNVLDLFNTFKGGFGGVNEKLVYPLENQSDYLGKIIFTPINDQDNTVDMRERTGGFKKLAIDTVVTYSNLLAGLFTDESVLDPSFKGLSETEKEEKIAKRAKNAVTSFTDNAANFYGEGGISDTPAFGGTDDADLLTDKKISLYLPKAIQIQDTVTYDNAFQLGLIGGAVEAGLAGNSSVAASIAGTIAAEVVGLGNTFFGGDKAKGMSKEAAGILSGKLASAIPKVGTGVGGAIRSASGLTTNPNTRAIFKDVPIRNFSFAFQLIPTSQNEAIVIEKIIKRFRTELYPTALQAGGVNVGYKFPNRFQIKVKYNNREINGIKFLPVYLQSFNATYNSASGGMHSDGRFTAIDISLTFTETRAITKLDVENGDY